MPDKTDNTAKKPFFSSMKAELKKVVWPTAPQVAKSTATTVGFVLLITLILVLLDLAFNQLSDLWWAWVAPIK